MRPCSPSHPFLVGLLALLVAVQVALVGWMVKQSLRMRGRFRFVTEELRGRVCLTSMLQFWGPVLLVVPSADFCAMASGFNSRVAEASARRSDRLLSTPGSCNAFSGVLHHFYMQGSKVRQNLHLHRLARHAAALLPWSSGSRGLDGSQRNGYLKVTLSVDIGGLEGSTRTCLLDPDAPRNALYRRIGEIVDESLAQPTESGGVSFGLQPRSLQVVFTVATWDGDGTDGIIDAVWSARERIARETSDGIAACSGLLSVPATKVALSIRNVATNVSPSPGDAMQAAPRASGGIAQVAIAGSGRFLSSHSPQSDGLGDGGSALPPCSPPTGPSAQVLDSWMPPFAVFLEGLASAGAFFRALLRRGGRLLRRQAGQLPRPETLERLLPHWQFRDHFRGDLDVGCPPHLRSPCGGPLELGTPTLLQRYLAMLMLGPALPARLGDLLRQRRRKFGSLVRYLALGMFMKYQARARSAVMDLCCLHRRQMQRVGTRTRLDRALETFFVQNVTAVFVMCLQVSLCTSYLAMWRRDYFVLNYIPVASFRVFLCALILLSAANEMDKCCGLAARYGTHRTIAALWGLVAVWMGIFGIPLLGTAAVNAQYLWSAGVCGWIEVEEAIFGAAYVRAARDALTCCWIFVSIAIVEAVAFFYLDFSEAHRVRFATAPAARLGSSNCVEVSEFAAGSGFAAVGEVLEAIEEGVEHVAEDVEKAAGWFCPRPWPSSVGAALLEEAEVEVRSGTGDSGEDTRECVRSRARPD